MWPGLKLPLTKPGANRIQCHQDDVQSGFTCSQPTSTSQNDFFLKFSPRVIFKPWLGKNQIDIWKLGRAWSITLGKQTACTKSPFFTLSFVSSVSSFPTKAGQGEFRAEGSKFGRNKPAREAGHHTREAITRGWIFETLLHLLLDFFGFFLRRVGSERMRQRNLHTAESIFVLDSSPASCWCYV